MKLPRLVSVSLALLLAALGATSAEAAPFSVTLDGTLEQSWTTDPDAPGCLRGTGSQVVRFHLRRVVDFHPEALTLTAARPLHMSDYFGPATTVERVDSSAVVDPATCPAAPADCGGPKPLLMSQSVFSLGRKGIRLTLQDRRTDLFRAIRGAYRSVRCVGPDPEGHDLLVPVRYPGNGAFYRPGSVKRYTVVRAVRPGRQDYESDAGDSARILVSGTLSYRLTLRNVCPTVRLPAGTIGTGKKQVPRGFTRRGRACRRI